MLEKLNEKKEKNKVRVTSDSTANFDVTTEVLAVKELVEDVTVSE